MVVGELCHGEMSFPFLDVLFDECSEKSGEGAVHHFGLAIRLRVTGRGEEELDAELGA